MTQETVQSTETAYFGMNPSQFGILMSLTSLSRQMQQMVEGQDMKDVMVKLIEDHPEKSSEDNLAWVRMQRNHLLNVLHGVMMSQNILAQIDDAIVNDLLSTKAKVEVAPEVNEQTEQ